VASGKIVRVYSVVGLEEIERLVELDYEVESMRLSPC